MLYFPVLKKFLLTRTPIAALNSSSSIEALKGIIDTLANRGEYMGETCIKLDHGMCMVARKLKKDLAYI